MSHIITCISFIIISLLYVLGSLYTPKKKNIDQAPFLVRSCFQLFPFFVFATSGKSKDCIRQNK
jgi:hypothetical protein